MKYSGINKIRTLIAAIFVISLGLLCLTTTPTKAHAEDISAKKLQYFELNRPIAVCRDGDKVYIAEKNKIVLYFNDTYRTTDLDSAYLSAKNEQKKFNVTDIAKCGNLLLFLSDNELYYATADSLTLSAQPILTEVSAFSVLGNSFIATKNENNAKTVKFFSVSEQSAITEFFPNYVTRTINGKKLPSAILLAENDESSKATYYYASDELCKVQNKIIYSLSNQAPSKLLLADGVIYLREKSAENDIIYSLNTLNNEKTPILELKNQLKNAGGFYISNQKLLICDTDNNQVVEFNLAGETPQQTEFEISFTKIDLPDGFAFSLNNSPEFINIDKDVNLYNVKLTQSFEKKYFVYNGMFKTKNKSEYLVLGEIKNGSDEYYLVHGDCTALVLKEDYSAQKITQSQPQKTNLIFANNSNIYKLPFIKSRNTPDEVNKLFILAQAERGEEVTVLKEFNLYGITFAYVKCKTHEGFIPLSCLTEKANDSPTRKSFLSATTSHKTTKVYSDKQLKTQTDELPAFSEVVICSDEDGVLYISYDNEKYGYIEKNCIVKKGDYVKRVVTVVILLALSLCIAAIFFERKYLYSKKNEEKE